MEIRRHTDMNTAKALKAEVAELKRAKNASEFKVRLDANGKIDRDLMFRMLTAARASKTYQRNSEQYQFKVKTEGGRQYLTLKQQGLWSSFKGFLGIGKAEREQQRAAAKDLITSNLNATERLVGQGVLGNMDGMHAGDPTRLSFSSAKEFQTGLMTTLGFAPRQGSADADNDEQGGRAGGREAFSGPSTMEGLMGLAPEIAEEPSRPSYRPVSSEAEVRPHANVPDREAQPVGRPGRDNSIDLNRDIIEDAYDQIPNPLSAEHRSTVVREPSERLQGDGHLSQTSDAAADLESPAFKAYIMSLMNPKL